LVEVPGVPEDAESTELTVVPEVTEQQRTNPQISARDFFIYLGPALIISLAFLDPGCLATDIAAGAGFNYDLIWTLVLASTFAILLQYLSGKLGIATGNSVSQLVRSSLKTRSRIIPYWLAAELAIAVTDLSEYMGTVIALNLLFGIPLLDASFLAAADVLILLVLSNGRFRLMEYAFMFFVSVISIGFLYELAIVGFNPAQVVIHTFAPTISQDSILIIVGIVGATVMPHTLWLHSGLTAQKAKRWGIKHSDEIPTKKLLRIHGRETLIILAGAMCVNVSILVMAASAFYPQYNIQQFSDAYNVLKPLFGPLAATVFAIGILASGISASTCGTLAGQEVMTSLLGIKVNKYLRRMVTRGINVFPVTILLLLGLSPFAILVYTQVVLSLLIPLPMIPIIWYTARSKVMGSFVNRKATSIIAVAVGVTIIALNAVLIYTGI
jgi:manganese transport protein